MKKQTVKRTLSVLLAAALLLGAAGLSRAAAEHSHTFYAAEVVSPGYMNGGSTVYRCACGESYSEPIPPRMEPFCVMTGGRVAPGGSITVRATLCNCSGLADLTLDVGYDTQVLRLTDAACAEYGVPERITDKALRFDAIDPKAQEAVLTLTFTADENAPNGVQTVSLSGCGVSACAVDNGEEIIMTASRAAVQVYRPPRLIVSAPADPVCTGDTVQVTIDLVNNPGVAGMAFAVQYDPQVLALTAASAEGMFTQGSVVMSGNLSAMPFRVLWDDASAPENHTEDGTVLTLTFTVRKTADAGITPVTVSIDPDDVLDVQLQAVELTGQNAELTILRRIGGDADGDGDVTAADVICLTRYIARGWNVEINALNSDVNRDGAIDLKDVVLIRRYLVGGWDVDLS